LAGTEATNCRRLHALCACGAHSKHSEQHHDEAESHSDDSLELSVLFVGGHAELTSLFLN